MKIGARTALSISKNIINAPEYAAIQNGHFGKRIIRAVDRKERKPFLLDGAFSKTMIGFDLQHGVFCGSISSFYIF